VTEAVEMRCAVEGKIQTSSTSRGLYCLGMRSPDGRYFVLLPDGGVVMLF
jgi:hypothetical protein